ncbi:zinc finger, c3HC4 type (RING finger) domain-containing protein [Ditylenchus destructor]|uniref:Zinc finger, c3HC4 type (RING finger) domain-containing protein n=1 Tax=Ditylenchus destructor TaxID=166010 RepID=A0AAD4N3W0_9BILA|nr:zinc finger, c3HC4 type (RING finger) domain-containing protein [Ditylenchus destructor]
MEQNIQEAGGSSQIAQAQIQEQMPQNFNQNTNLFNFIGQNDWFYGFNQTPFENTIPYSTESHIPFPVFPLFSPAINASKSFAANSINGNHFEMGYANQPQQEQPGPSYSSTTLFGQASQMFNMTPTFPTPTISQTQNSRKTSKSGLSLVTQSSGKEETNNSKSANNSPMMGSEPFNFTDQPSTSGQSTTNSNGQSTPTMSAAVNNRRFSSVELSGPLRLRFTAKSSTENQNSSNQETSNDQSGSNEALDLCENRELNSLAPGSSREIQSSNNTMETHCRKTAKREATDSNWEQNSSVPDFCRNWEFGNNWTTLYDVSMNDISAFLEETQSRNSGCQSGGDGQEDAPESKRAKPNNALPVNTNAGASSDDDVVVVMEKPGAPKQRQKLVPAEIYNGEVVTLDSEDDQEEQPEREKDDDIGSVGSYNFSASPAYTDLTPPDSNNYNEDDEDSRNSSEYPVRSAAAQVCHELKIEELKQKYYRIKDEKEVLEKELYETKEQSKKELCNLQNDLQYKGFELVHAQDKAENMEHDNLMLRSRQSCLQTEIQSLVHLRRTDAQTIADLKQQNQHLQEENDRQNREATCIICLDNKREVLFLPCMHFNHCDACAKQINQCGTCRTNIRAKLNVFQ